MPRTGSLALLDKSLSFEIILGVDVPACRWHLAKQKDYRLGVYRIVAEPFLSVLFKIHPKSKIIIKVPREF